MKKSILTKEEWKEWVSKTLVCSQCGQSLWGRDKYYWDEEYERYFDINVLRNKQGEFDENPYEERILYCEACIEGSELENYDEDGILQGEDEIANPE